GFAIAAEFPKPQLSRNRGFVGIRIFQGANRKLIYPSQFRIKAVPLCVRGSIDAPSPGEFGRRGDILRPGGSQNSSGRLAMRWVPPTMAETSSSADPRKSAGQGRRVDASTRLR